MKNKSKDPQYIDPIMVALRERLIRNPRDKQAKRALKDRSFHLKMNLRLDARIEDYE